MTNRRTLFAATAAAAAGSVLAACSGAPGKSSHWVPAGTGGPGTPGGSPAPLAADLVITPAAAAANVLPNQPVVVTARTGTLTGVTVSGGGKQIAGTLAADQKSWRSTGQLGYGQTYTVTAAGVGGDGTPVQQKVSFSTLKPAGTASVTLQANVLAQLHDGGTYGVGQPVIVHFSRAPADKAAALAALQVQATPAVPGAWYWVDRQSVHYRPEKYWAPGTKITVRADVFAVHLGGNVYGSGNTSASITIGPSRIAIADSSTHQMQVFLNGTLARTIPISLGKGGTTTGSKGEVVNFWTRSGVHVVMEKDSTVRMNSASYGVTDPTDPNFYDETVELCCRITYSGEYVHSAPWSVADQGKRNVSHGCVNVSPANAQWFYNTFGLGDVVDIRNTPRRMQLGDGVGGDWEVSWTTWSAGN